MDRFQMFHFIATQSDLSSMKSILRNAIHQLMIFLEAQRGGYFATGAGGLRPLVTLEGGGAETGHSLKNFPQALLQRVVVSGKAQSGESPQTASSGKPRFKRFIAVPTFTQKQIIGVVFLERRHQSSPFRNDEIAAVSHLLEDIQSLLYSSRDYEKQSLAIDTMKSRMAMNRVNLVSDHPAMIHLFRYIHKLAKVPTTVLIHGESGTGKELVARALYEFGDYRGHFLCMNCGGLETNLLKSELFGYLKGSFTGAQKDRPGLFKKAENGVLFMDEVGDMPMEMQIALLRTLESGELLPLGADEPIRVNTRVVAATHQNLRELVAKGSFRNDLYQRLKGFTLEVPPLRKRGSDIPLLCDFFIKKYNQRFDLNFKGLLPEALEILSHLDYAAGNVRELEHMIERAMVFEDDPDYIGTKHLLAEDMEESTRSQISGGTFEERMNRYAQTTLNEAISACNGNKTKAMKSLGLSRSTFYGMLNRYGVKLQGDPS